MRISRVGLIVSAVAFARSERGQQMIADARQRLDTPENRAKLNEVIEKLRNRPPGAATRGAR